MALSVGDKVVVEKTECGLSIRTSTLETEIVTTQFLLLDGSRPMEGNLHMDSNRITNLPEPLLDYESATKKYVDDTVGATDHSLLSSLNWAAAGHTIDANIVPTSDSTRDLGSATYAFANLYCDKLTGAVADILLGKHLIPTTNSSHNLGSAAYAYNTLFTYNLDTYSTNESIDVLASLDMTLHAIENVTHLYIGTLRNSDTNIGLYTDIIPATDSTYDLGDATHTFANIYANRLTIDRATNPIIYFKQSGITQGYLWFNSGNLYIESVLGNLQFRSPTGEDIQFLVAGTSKMIVDATNTTVKTNIIPNTDSTYDLGSSTKAFANLYCDKLTGAVADILLAKHLLPTTNSSHNLGSASYAYNTLYVYNLSGYTTESQIECLKNFDMNAHDIYNVDGVYFNATSTIYITEDGASNVNVAIPIGNVLNFVNGNKITGVVDPTANQDAATKKYVDDNAVSDHSLLSNLNWAAAGHTIDANIVPTSDSTRDLGSATYAFANLYCDKLTGAVADILLGKHLLPTTNSSHNLGSASYAYNTLYVYNLSGYTTESQIECLKNFDMNAHDIYNVDGIYFNATSTIYITEDGASNVNVAIPVGNVLNFVNGNKITGVVDPTANQDAATKKYVDDNAVSDHSLLSNLNWAAAGHTIDANIVPTSDSTRDLGSATYAFANLYCDKLTGAVADILLAKHLLPTTNSSHNLGSASYAYNTLYVYNLSSYTTKSQIECLKNFDMNAHDVYNIDGAYFNAGSTTFIDDDGSGNMRLHVATGKTVKIVVA